jgi:hypothetical protein
MRGRGVRLVLLCEDDEHWRFARLVFLRLGYHSRELRVSLSPAARGAAERWVRQQYPNQVRMHRRKASFQNVGLLLVIDADKQTVDYRHQQLSNALDEAGLDQRGPREPIVIWVPKRHIETWVADLLGHAANEDDDYKNLVRDADYRVVAGRFADRYQKPADRPANLIPSMSRAFDEMERLPASQ